MAHGMSDADEVLPELAGNVFETRVFFCQLQCDGEHVERIHRHPTGTVRLFDVAAGGQRRAAVDEADVIEAKKSALENVPAFGVLAIDPPGEIQHQLVKYPL